MNWGKKTFDVILSSNNLEVEVDDFDNPYHKVDVYFGPVLLKEYMELAPWWKFAQIRYEQFPEPKQINEA
jgi:hypothetical protein